MSYEPTEWKSGDVITSAKLNKMEQGIAAGGTGGGGLVVNLVYDEDNNVIVCDKTWKEISNASKTMPVVMRAEVAANIAVYYPLTNVESPTPFSPNEYVIGFADLSSDLPKIVFAVTDSENGYPSASLGD